MASWSAALNYSLNYLLTSKEKLYINTCSTWHVNKKRCTTWAFRSCLMLNICCQWLSWISISRADKRVFQTPCWKTKQKNVTSLSTEIITDIYLMAMNKNILIFIYWKMNTNYLLISEECNTLINKQAITWALDHIFQSSNSSSNNLTSWIIAADSTSSINSPLSFR